VKTTTTTTVENGPTRRSAQRDPFGDEEISRDTLVRRQDQKIKDDITNKLYRVELDRVKPGYDVQMQTSNFRSSVPRRLLFTPEPSLQIVPYVEVKDRRRYSTAGNLEIYRPKTHHVYEYPPLTTYEYVRSGAAPSYLLHDPGHTSKLLDEHEVRQLAELSVRGRPTNGPTTQTEITYWPLASTTRRCTTPPPEIYRRTTVDQYPALRSAPRVSSAGRKVSDGQYELDQFEKLMKRNFGAGGVNRTKTLLYTEPQYGGTYDYTSISPYYTGTGGYYGRSYYGGRPYYGGSYPSYYSPYYYGYTPYSYEYANQRPVDYQYGRYYSPATRVTAPWEYPRHYDSDYYSRYWTPSRYSTYSYVL